MYHGEQRNAVTHLTGAALTGAVVLDVLAAQVGDPWKTVSVPICGLTVVVPCTVSTLQHSVSIRAKNAQRELDCQSIHLLIAGSCTSIRLVTLRGPWGWSLLGVVWGLAVLGCLQEPGPTGRSAILSVVIYVAMG